MIKFRGKGMAQSLIGADCQIQQAVLSETFSISSES